MRTIGIDLGVTAPHKAMVADERGQFVSSLLSFHSDWRDLERVVASARVGVASDEPLQAVMEPTGMAWFTVATGLSQLGVTPIYLVNGRKVHDLRKFYKRHSSSDRISARVLAKMPVVDAESLYPLELPTAGQLTCQRGCKELDRLETLTTAIQNRLRDTDRFAWPGLEERVFKDIFSPAARWFRSHWYDPAQVVAAGAGEIRRGATVVVEAKDDLSWVEELVRLASELVKLYRPERLDYRSLQQEVERDQRRLASFEQEADGLWQDTVRPAYHQLHPSRHLESLYGVGERSGAVYASFIGRVGRFPDQPHFRGWHGLVPDSRQSGESESQGLHVSQAGPDPVKKFAYLGADVARHYDPQIAALYYDQMVNKGKSHAQAVCACATHLLDRVRIILLEDRPYELRDVDGTPVTPEQARIIIAEHYTVPDEVRARRKRRARQERAAQRAEQMLSQRRRSKK